MSETAAQPKLPHPGIQILVIIHLFLIISWTLPGAPPDVASGEVEPTPANIVRRAPDFLYLANAEFKDKSPTSYYLQTTGFWQYWDMFAPNPANVDLWLDAEIEYEDGSVRTVPYPRMYDLPIPQKYVMERYRKFTERLNFEDYRWKWPQFAYRMAIKGGYSQDNLPVRLTLRRHFRTIEKVFEDQDKPYETYEFHTEIIDPRKLKEME